MTALLFRDARLVDGLADEPVDGVAVLVIDGRIAEIGTPGSRRRTCRTYASSTWRAGR